MLVSSIKSLQFSIDVLFGMDHLLIFHDLLSVVAVSIDGQRSSIVDTSIVVERRSINL